MASDPAASTDDSHHGSGTGGADASPPSDEHLREIIREEIEEFVNDLTDLGSGDPPAGDPAEADKPLTTAGIEQAMERGMRKAIGELNRKPRKTPPKDTGPPPEPPPTDPPKGWLQKLREQAWS